jgi:uridine kinase
VSGSNCVIVGICGGSASGKSLMARALLELLADDTIIISQDAYYHDSSHLQAAERDSKNYDHPDAIDQQLFFEDLNRLARGQAIQSREYCFASHRSLLGKHCINPAAVIIVEGLFIFQHQQLRQIYDLKVFMHATSEDRLKRRILRDSQERGRTREDITRQYFTTVKPMHDRHVEPNRLHAEEVFSPSNVDQLNACAENLAKRIALLRRRNWPT